MWGNQADGIAGSKEKLNEHKFIWSKRMSTWNANGDKTGFSRGKELTKIMTQSTDITTDYL